MKGSLLREDMDELIRASRYVGMPHMILGKGISFSFSFIWELIIRVKIIMPNKESSAFGFLITHTH
jgi:hypothetical protein